MKEDSTTGCDVPQDSVSRRDMAKYLVTGTGAALAGLSAASLADDESSNNTDDHEQPEQPSPLDVQMAWLFDRYPSEHLTDDQIAAIRRDVHRRRVQSSILRQFPLDHTDAPALVFAAYRSGE